MSNTGPGRGPPLHGHDYTAPPPSYSAAPTGVGPSSPREPLLPRGWETDDVPDDFKIGVNVSECDLSIRMAFVRKVYSILAVQLLMTILVGSYCMYNDSAKAWVQSHPGFIMGSMLATIVISIALVWKRRSYPTNYILLGTFTLLEAYAVGSIVTFYDQVLVMQALMLTFGLFVALTVFTLQSKWDFSGLGPFLLGALILVLLASLVHMFFFPFDKTFDLILAIGIVILFSGFVMYDTYMIMNRSSPEDYIVAAVELYMDIINLFLAILRILDATKD